MNHTEKPSGARVFGLIVLALFLSPVSVAIEYGVQSSEFLCNILLWLFIPLGGFIHAIVVLCRARYNRPKYANSPEERYRYNAPANNSQYNQAMANPPTETVSSPPYTGPGANDVKR